MRYTKVGDLDRTIRRFQQVGWLDVTMNDSLHMEIFQAQDNIAEYRPRDSQWQNRAFVRVLPLDLAAFHVFDHEIDLSGRRIVNDFDEADNMRVDALFHDGNLATDLLLVRCLGPSQASTGSLVHNLDGTEFVRSCIPTQLDLAVDTSTQLLDDHVLVNHLVSSHGIILLHHLVGFFDGLRGGRCDGSPR